MQTSQRILTTEHRRVDDWSGTRLSDLFAANAARVPERLAVVDPPNRAALEAENRAPRLRALSAIVDATVLALGHAGLRRGDVLVTSCRTSSGTSPSTSPRPGSASC